jgi:DNA primase|tara:strand:+ start:64 stop:1845 length:1782 start_codon:yes stop_codon:yes gene_type:complete
MKYPKEYLDEIKLRLKVSQVVGKTVQLKKRGKEYVGLSPFKNEKSPSFTVSDEKEFYHCFSTGEHGNIFDFLVKTKSMGFGEVVKVLAAEAGMTPYKFSNFDEKKEKKFKTYKNIYTDYSNFFYSELFNNNEAINYLKKRGLSKQTVEEFALGYVPWKNNFYETLLKKYTEEEINSSGLYYKNDKTGKYTDRFNSRIIFPVKNLSGDTIAFGGRIIKESKMAKYINSPETDFYKKGNMLFNLDKAKSMRSETDQIIIVEGYMDVISLYSSGIKNVVSNSGTALTENQIELIWKFFSEPVVCLDGDESGQKAASRIAERLLPLINENNKIYFSMLPNGEDPDDFIKKNGKLNFLKLLDQKKIIQLYIWDLYSANLDKNDPFAISKFEKEIKKKCFAIKDETLKKYILEDFLERIKNLTPLQNFKKNFKKYKIYNKNNFKLLNETKALHLQKNHLNREQLKEYSVLFIMLNYKSIAESRTEELSEINFSTKECEELKNLIIKHLLGGLEKEDYKNKMNKNFENLIKEIEKNSNLTNIMSKKETSEKQELLDELMQDLKEMNHFKRIEFLEGEAAKNLDESSYSELMKLKSQLNGE